MIDIYCKEHGLLKTIFHQELKMKIKPHNIY